MTENNVCRNCKNQFVIEPEDFDFYEKIGVPEPQMCPECRMQRRFAWRNERTLFRNVCAATGKPIISCFSKESNMTVYERDYWWSDAWDPLSFGQDYDFSKPFFRQFSEFLRRVPMPSVFNARTINCDYSNHSGESKNGYLVSACWNLEDGAYASRVISSRDIFDCYAIAHGELCYGDIESLRISRVFFSEQAENSTNSAFLYDCKNCTDCFGCTSLRNKNHHIFNEPYMKDEYKRKLTELDLGSYINLERIKMQFQMLKFNAIRKYARQLNCKNSTGDNIVNSSNCHACYDLIDDVRDSKWCINGGVKMYDSYDGYGVGANAEMLYEAVDTGVQGQRFAFCIVVWGGNDVSYSLNCHGCQNCFGCIGLRNKSYCILNRQCTRDQYLAQISKIESQMLKDGEYGEFFPISISPYGYNETIAQDYFPLTKEQALAMGYQWHDRPAPESKPALKAADLPDHIKNADDAILKEIIECARCQRPYRFIKRELDFLKRFSIALPRECFECRHLNRFRQVNFPRLYYRQCMCKTGHLHGNTPCANEFETTYFPNRSETIYCEACYNAEIV